MAEGRKVRGKFVWHDLMTTDIDRAVEFYTALLGWSIKEVEMEGFGAYRMIHAAGTEHGGFVQLGPEDPFPAHWISYATVDDVDAATAKAVELGGQAPVPGLDIPGVGRFGVVVSPRGAVISPYASSSTSSGEEAAEVPRVGTFCWHELLAADPPTEAEFFCDIFGWRTEEVPMGDMGTYTLFKRLDTGRDAGGMLPKPGGEGPSSWLPYVLVESADATAARVGELGGKVWVQPTDIPGVGRFLVTSDPQGAFIAFLQPPAG